MTDLPPDEKPQGNKMPEDPFANVPLKESGNVEKNGFRLVLLFVLLILGLILFILSPLPYLVIGYIPQNWVEKAVDDVYKQVPIIDKQTTFEQPVKLPIQTPLPVYGINTGLCFTFLPERFQSEEQSFTPRQLQKRIKGAPFVEIIIRNEDKQEFSPKDVIVSETINKQKEKIISICFEFGTEYSIIPENVPEIFIRPKEKFTAERVFWHTTKTVF